MPVRPICTCTCLHPVLYPDLRTPNPEPCYPGEMGKEEDPNGMSVGKPLHYKVCDTGSTLLLGQMRGWWGLATPVLERCCTL